MHIEQPGVTDNALPDNASEVTVRCKPPPCEVAAAYKHPRRQQEENHQRRGGSGHEASAREGAVGRKVQHEQQGSCHALTAAAITLHLYDYDM